MLGTSTPSEAPGLDRRGLRPSTGGVAPSLLKLAGTLRKGGATAGMLVASEGVSGFQIIVNPETATFEELRRELAALRARLEDSLHTGSTSPSAAIDEARQSLSEASTELARPNTEVPRILQRLGWAADHLHQAGEEARITDDLTPALAQLAVAAATLWTITSRILGDG